MTFTKWWDENQDEIKCNISHQNFTGIKADFEACWHDGYTQCRHLSPKRYQGGKMGIIEKLKALLKKWEDVADNAWDDDNPSDAIPADYAK